MGTEIWLSGDVVVGIIVLVIAWIPAVVMAHVGACRIVVGRKAKYVIPIYSRVVTRTAAQERHTRDRPGLL